MSTPDHIRYNGQLYRRRCRVAVWSPSKGTKNFSATDLLEAFPDLGDAAGALAEDAQSAYGQKAEAFLEKLDKAIGGFGTEVIRSEDAWDSYYGDIVAEYVNTGDAYTATVVHDIGEDELYLTTYGDWLQAWEHEKEQEKEEG